MATPLYVEGVKGQVLPVVGHVVRHGVASPERHSETAETCVVEAKGNCEATSVLVAKKFAAVGVEVPATSPLASTARMRFAMLVSHTEEVAVKSEVEALVKFCVAVHQFELARLRPQSLIAPAPVYDEPLRVASFVSAPRVAPREMPLIVEWASWLLPMVEEAMTRPVASVARSDIVEGEVRYVAPVLVNIVVEAWVALKSPTTVDDACETKPPLRVERPFTESVPKVPVLAFAAVEVAVPKVPTPETVSVPIAAVFPFSVVEVAVPNVPVPVTARVPMLPVLPLTVVEVEVVKKAVVPEIAVVEAYGKIEAKVVEVATT